MTPPEMRKLSTLSIGRAPTRAGNAVAAASLTTLAQDVGSWRTAIVTGDAVNETIALDRILSELSSVPGC